MAATPPTPRATVNVVWDMDTDDDDDDDDSSSESSFEFDTGECFICRRGTCPKKQCQLTATKPTCCRQPMCCACFCRTLVRCRCSRNCRRVVGTACHYCREMTRATALQLLLASRPLCRLCAQREADTPPPPAPPPAEINSAPDP